LINNGKIKEKHIELLPKRIVEKIKEEIGFEDKKTKVFENLVEKRLIEENKSKEEIIASFKEKEPITSLEEMD
jgi:hypothetical protein